MIQVTICTAGYQDARAIRMDVGEIFIFFFSYCCRVSIVQDFNYVGHFRKRHLQLQLQYIKIGLIREEGGLILLPAFASDVSLGIFVFSFTFVDSSDI